MTLVMGELAVASGGGRVRILSSRGSVYGAGVLVAPGFVLTCAHVVASAAAEPGDRASPDGPPGPVLIDIVENRVAGSTTATVIEGGWFPGPLSGDGHGDLAVLGGLAWSSPRDVVPAVLAECGEPDRREVGVYGHPSGAPDGIWALARLVGRGGPHQDWIQLEGLGPTGVRIGPGFSGAAVWDQTSGRVIGLITAAYTDRATKVAWMLPAEAITRMCRSLTVLTESTAPAPPALGAGDRHRPSAEEQFALAEALMNVAQIEEDGAATLRLLLPPGIRHNIREHARPRLQMFYIVQACADHRGGRQALARALTLIDESSESATAALALLDRLWPTASHGGAV
ncbi:effector-associated domain 2-containing protein [Streptomyces phaeochromogenes]|uniref:effector-associated domain 2-containing protein n=1 Tax=Streptomyces phaeochromogenes TaxID=1923 RepID=UPI0033C7A4B9